MGPMERVPRGPVILTLSTVLILASGASAWAQSAATNAYSGNQGLFAGQPPSSGQGAAGPISSALPLTGLEQPKPDEGRHRRS